MVFVICIMQPSEIILQASQAVLRASSRPENWINKQINTAYLRVEYFYLFLYQVSKQLENIRFLQRLQFDSQKFHQVLDPLMH